MVYVHREVCTHYIQIMYSKLLCIFKDRYHICTVCFSCVSGNLIMLKSIF